MANANLAAAALDGRIVDGDRIAGMRVEFDFGKVVVAMP